MNFNKLSIEKRNHLIAIALATVFVLASLGFGVGRWQIQVQRKLNSKRAALQLDLTSMKNKLKWADQIERELADGKRKLAELEEGLAPANDALSWLVNTINEFVKKSYKVDIRFPAPLSPPVEMPLLPKFPYRQVTLRVMGQAYYQDFGHFVADFENQFPYIRILNLTLDSQSGAATADEKLDFQMDVVALIKTNTT